MPHVHVDCPVAVLDVPNGHVKQVEDEEYMAYVLTAQDWHGPNPLVEYWPGLHVHARAFPPGLEAPAGQLVHVASVAGLAQ